MYEELVKRLRAVTDGSHEDKCDGCPYDEDYPCCVDCLDTMLKQAADAIEELSKRIDRAVELYNRGVERSAMYEALVGIAPEPPKEEET